MQNARNLSDAGTADYALIRAWIWVYFILLIFEGALRKWVFPGQSDILLLVRDPIVIWIYYLAYSQNVFPTENKYLNRLYGWTILACVISLIFNQTHPAVIAYGIHTNLLHFPLIFVIGHVLRWKDVIRFGYAILFLSLPMTFFCRLQFQGEAGDWSNVNAGGVGTQLETSGGKVRASGTFSFVSGIVFFYCFAVAFIIYGFLRLKTFWLPILIVSFGLTLTAMAIAGSRAVVAECLQVVACFGFLAYIRPQEFGKITLFVFGLTAITIFLWTQIDIFIQGIDHLRTRFKEAENVEGHPIEAYFNRYWDIISAPYKYNKGWFHLGNEGLGSATRGGSELARRFGSGGWVGGAEISWSRPIIENGLAVGSLFIFWRIWVAIDLLKACIRSIKRGNYLAIFLFGAAGPIILFGLLGQPTNLGFAAFGGGLCLAAARARNFA
ncbi:hypothetical protein OAK38_04170 [Verrucomicrobia bacterium]|nr:hypothetical protein [Verrucomicrobiota bacterium]